MWYKLQETEVVSAEAFVLYLIPKNLLQDHSGVIMNISASLYFKGNLLQAHAGSAKAAIGLNYITLVHLCKRSVTCTQNDSILKLHPPFVCDLRFSDALTKHMAVEWGPQNIRVVGLAPGPIAETEGMRKLGKNCVFLKAGCILSVVGNQPQ